MHSDTTQDYYELPSINEAAATSQDFTSDDLEDGPYQFQITRISQQLANPNPKKDGSPGNPRRAFTLVVVNADNPSDVGKKVQFYANESMHSTSNFFPFFKAAMGGDLDPSVRPNLYDVLNKQVRGTVVHEPGRANPNQLYQNYTGWTPAKKTFDLVPF